MSTKSYKNLIFLPDSPYSNWIIDRSEKLPFDGNLYVCCEPKQEKINHPICNHFPFNSESFKSNIGKISDYERVIIHYHKSYLGYFINKHRNTNTKIIWVLWSGDLYVSGFFGGNIYQEITKTIINKPATSLYWKFREYIKSVLGKPNYWDYKESFKKIEYIATPFDLDFDLACITFKQRYKRVDFKFLSVDELFDKSEHVSIKSLGNKILVGHTGSPENNHIDLFQKLISLNLTNTLLCPLSYGNEQYISKVISEGKMLFNNQFEIIKDFMPRKDYYKKLDEVGFAIFNTNIHQGFGNILGLIYKGVKVFLNRENSIYIQLKRWDIIVFDIDEFNSESFLVPLKLEEIKQNRALILSLFNDRVVNDCYYNLYSL
ncbi:TDP-N-acetylfucosamine:lipid II N-acetylfucosaminyltransferase [Litoribacter alkaliphilus]|uniref:TDP-N-acetylfucosamine:lipid II N-acetylfucosaminyltransferase n=1 Tax=Litoribacter ruber TaxID=702568 RepID=A0AAP2CJ44_9BACT|nr:TDP-N-acetylfucosamine:lipid II N-acetylfucosaminyltransferase [Litoribacter alkaliphilus]MBS9525691.1 TDP-N-acetylfucosamine:lipid II N-acetylfucosaminyltransferase [Litoribacter alkaliphilus]